MNADRGSFVQGFGPQNPPPPNRPNLNPAGGQINRLRPLNEQNQANLQAQQNHTHPQNGNKPFQSNGGTRGTHPPPSNNPNQRRGPPQQAPMNQPAALPPRTDRATRPAVNYTPQEAAQIQSQLNRVLGPEYVSFRPGGGGQNVSYIEGWRALNLANEIFGFNGWSSEVISVQVDFLDSHGSGRVSLGLSVVVRITIRDGTYHEDFGYGFIENAKNKAMAFEKCKKEAFTDGLKRCLRCFGNVLGNCLYDKSIVAKMQKVLLPAPELEADDFHRDPLVVKRELQRQRREAPPASIKPEVASEQAPSGQGVPANPPPAQNTALNAASKAHLNGSTLTSNGLAREPSMSTPAPASNTTSVATTMSASASTTSKAKDLDPGLVKDYDLDAFDDLFVFSDDLPADEANAPAQVFFTSSRKALDVQNTADPNDIPVYDHRFVASSVKRTVDPSRSVKIRRSDLPSQIPSSQTNSAALPAVGKRPLGMPPSQRLAYKRHKEGE